MTDYHANMRSAKVRTYSDRLLGQAKVPKAILYKMLNPNGEVIAGLTPWEYGSPLPQGPIMFNLLIL